MDFFQVTAFLGFLLRILGALVFGVAIGYLTIRLLHREDIGWQVIVSTYLGLLAAYVLYSHWLEGGGSPGAFGLGIGGALLGWGLLAGRKKAEPPPDEAPMATGGRRKA
jgi:NhaP-type Na+/H+ or K+/H+ antiporter